MGRGRLVNTLPHPSANHSSPHPRTQQGDLLVEGSHTISLSQSQPCPETMLPFKLFSALNGGFTNLTGGWEQKLSAKTSSLVLPGAGLVLS